MRQQAFIAKFGVDAIEKEPRKGSEYGSAFKGPGGDSWIQPEPSAADLRLSRFALTLSNRVR